MVKASASHFASALKRLAQSRVSPKPFSVNDTKRDFETLASVPGIYKPRLGPTAEAVEIHSAYQKVWSLLAKSSCDGEVFNQNGVLIVKAGGKWPVMNTVFLTSPVSAEDDLHDRISNAKQYFGQKGTWLFIPFNEWLASSIRVEEVFWRNGLCLMQDCVGMQTKRLVEQTTPAPELEFRLVKTDTERLDFSGINADGYGFSSEWGSDIARWTSHWPTEDVQLYVAYLGKVGVSAAMVYSMGGVAYLGFVATRRGHQRKGYAEATARHALAPTREHPQFSKSILHSTPAGLSLYRTLGYSEVSRFGVYLGGWESLEQSNCPHN